MKRLTTAFATILLTSVVAAHAVTITGNYTISISATGEGGATGKPLLSGNLGSSSVSNNVVSGSFSSVGLVAGGAEHGATTSTSYSNFFTTTPAGGNPCHGNSTCGIGYYGDKSVVTDTVKVQFSNLVESGVGAIQTTPATSSALADYTADYADGVTAHQTDYDMWEGYANNTTPPCTPSGKGVDGCLVLSFNLPDGHNTLDIILNNAADWAITPTISFQVVQGQGGNTTGRAPEPASLALLGSALVGIGLIRRRRGRL